MDVCSCTPSRKPLKHAVSYITSYGNIKPNAGVKPGDESDIRPERVTAALRVQRQFHMHYTEIYDTRDAAALNISCFTCEGKPEANDVFADQTLMSCEKYERRRNVHYSQRGIQQLPEKASAQTEQAYKYAISQICARKTPYCSRENIFELCECCKL